VPRPTVELCGERGDVTEPETKPDPLTRRHALMEDAVRAERVLPQPARVLERGLSNRATRACVAHAAK
jgi:hypothetical protein